MIPDQGRHLWYPPDLQTLVDGVAVKGTAKGKYKFLARFP